MNLLRSLLASGADPKAVDNSGQGAREWIDRRIEFLELGVRRYGRMRCIHPQLVKTLDELELLRQSRTEILKLLGCSIEDNADSGNTLFEW